MSRERKIFFLYNLHRYEIEFYELLEGPAEADIDALEVEFYTRFGLEFHVSGKFDNALYEIGMARMIAEGQEQGWIERERPIWQPECHFLEWLKARKGFTIPDPARAVMQEFARH